MSSKNKQREVWFSVDIEASGGPFHHSMIALGACVIGDPERRYTIYQELRPRTEETAPDPAAMKVNGLDWEQLKRTGLAPHYAMTIFRDWIKDITWKMDGEKAVFVSFGDSDWVWVYSYLGAYTEDASQPFGPNSLDLKSWYAGWQGCDWQGTQKRHMPPHHLLGRQHTHNALDDAIEQAELIEHWLKLGGPKRQMLGTFSSGPTYTGSGDNVALDA